MVGAPSVLSECDGWWPEWLPGSDASAAARVEQKSRCTGGMS